MTQLLRLNLSRHVHISPFLTEVTLLIVRENVVSFTHSKRYVVFSGLAVLQTPSFIPITACGLYPLLNVNTEPDWCTTQVSCKAENSSTTEPFVVSFTVISFPNNWASSEIRQSSLNECIR